MVTGPTEVMRNDVNILVPPSAADCVKYNIIKNLIT